MTKPVRALGLMSGTSLDGIDVALLTTDGEAVVERGPVATYPYPQESRAALRQALVDAAVVTERQQRPGCLADVERELTQRHAESVREFLGGHGIAPEDIDVIGFHGQTVLHRPEDRLTVQLGDGPLLAGLTGIDVVHDLRAADVAAGGQGAPLVPVYHRALAAGLAERPVAFLNVGGVANLTWIGLGGDDLIAFDTGPGNALIDDWVHVHTGAARDDDGALGLAGMPNARVLACLLAHPYFQVRPPKSLDRNAFDLGPVRGLSLEDGAATLAAFTAEAVRIGASQLPQPPVRWVVCGGGRHNRSVMRMLQDALEANVLPAEAIGIDGDGLEAEAWAYLAVRSLRELPITFPMTTGVPRPMTGGVLAPRRSSKGPA